MSDAAADLQSLWTAPSVYRRDLFVGKVVLVAGGGGGIGRAVALLFARLGAEVLISGRNAEKLQGVVDFGRAHGASISSTTANLREYEQTRQLFDCVRERHGRLDHVVNCAGGQFALPAIDYTPNGWNAVITNNLNGSWFLMQQAAQHWRDHGGHGSIVNVVVVTDRGMPGIAHTVAARAGVIGVTRTVAVEWAPLGIRVNCVAPGLIDTEGLQVYPPEGVREFPLANPMKRLGTALEIAEACIYLSAPSGGFITGEVLTVDGGGRLWGEMWTAGRPDYFRIDAGENAGEQHSTRN